MPTYQYACTECGHQFEIVQSFSEDSLTQCPQCQGRLRKVYNAVGVVFKGSGFYRTDSRGKVESSSSDSSGDSSGSSGSEKSAAEKSETKSDKKPEKKSETTPAAKAGTQKSGAGSTG